MRHKYRTRAIVLARSPLGEANTTLTLVTRDMGLIRARAEGLRHSGARLGGSLITFAESDVTLVRGKHGWRLVGAELDRHWARELAPAARERAGRTSGLLLRLAPTETGEGAFFVALSEAFALYLHEHESLHEAIECRTVLQLLATLGLDDGEVPDIETARREKSELVVRINRGISLSGL